MGRVSRPVEFVATRRQTALESRPTAILHKLKAKVRLHTPREEFVILVRTVAAVGEENESNREGKASAAKPGGVEGQRIKCSIVDRQVHCAAHGRATLRNSNGTMCSTMRPGVR